MASTRALRLPARGRPFASVGAAIRLVWSLTFDAVRDFVWGDLKDGILDLRGLPLTLRALVWLGFALVIATVGTLLVGDVWRASSDLVPLTQGIPGRGRLVPSALVPATLFLIAVAWSFVLAGALHAHPLIRLSVLVVYCLSFAGSTNSGIFSGPLSLVVAAGGLLGIILVFALRWRARARAAFEFVVILLLVSASSAMLQAQGYDTWRISGLPVMVTRLSFDVQGTISLITPLLFLVGMGIAGFVAKLAGWGVAIAEDRLPRWSPFPLLALALGWQLWGVVPSAVERLAEDPRVEALSLLNALLVPVVVGLVWLVATRVAARGGRAAGGVSVEDVTEAADRWAPRVIVAYTAPLLVAFLISISALVLVVMAASFGALHVAQAALVNSIGTLASPPFQFGWHLVVDGLAVAAALLFARRGHRGPALYLGTYALLDFKSELSGAGQILAAFTSPVPAARAELWWSVIVAGAALLWLARRGLTRRRAGHLLFVTIVLILLGQTNFISNRFSPFFGFAGIAFLAFGLVWDALTIGSWANVDSRALPRTSRIFLYLGYTLLTVAVVNWAVASHDLAAVGRLTGDVGVVGLDRFGRPMLYAIFAVMLALPRADRTGTEDMQPEDLGVDDPDDEPRDAPSEDDPRTPARHARSGPSDASQSPSA